MHAIEKQAWLHVFTKQLSVALLDDTQTKQVFPYLTYFFSVVLTHCVHVVSWYTCVVICDIMYKVHMHTNTHTHICEASY